MTTWNQHLVRRNDWRSIEVPELGAWTPTLSVSVVIPSWNAGLTLPYVLAGLSGQTYPAHLLEVIVVDDGTTPPLELSEVRPEHTQLVRNTTGWGRSSARNLGVELSEGDVVLVLDSDMMTRREHVEAQMRWHHAIDYAVVLGSKMFIDPTELYANVTPAQARDLIAAGTDHELFVAQPPTNHKWVEGMWRRTDALTRAGTRGFRSHVGATGSVRRDLLDEVGEMAVELVLGEDVEHGYRLGEAGGVLVPEKRAESWHLGPSHVMKFQDRVNRHNDAYLSNVIPGMRPKRNVTGRIYDVPYLEVVLRMGEMSDPVIACVDAVLESELFDLRVVLLGDWDRLDWVSRRSPLGDPDLEARIVERTYRNEPRVELRSELPEGRCRSPHRLDLESADWVPSHRALRAMLEDVERTHEGGRTVVADGQVVAALRATSAVSRAQRVGATTTAEIDEVIATAYGSQRLTVEEAGWVPTSEYEVARYEGKLERDWDPVTSREVFDATLRGAESGASTDDHTDESEPARQRGLFRRS